MSFNIARGKFDSTQWTLVERAASADIKIADEAVSEIFKRYWAPLYVFARCKGMNGSDAEDIIQTFFADLLEKRLLLRADQRKGKLRTFFLTVVERIILQKQRGEMAQKRGGETTTFSIDQAREEDWFMSEPAENMTPESIYDKRWALSVLELALLNLRGEYEEKGKVELFDALKSYLGWNEGEESYGEIAREHQMTEGAVRVAVYRLLKKYKKSLQAQIADTIGSADAELIHDEIQHLFTALA